MNKTWGSRDYYSSSTDTSRDKTVKFFKRNGLLIGAALLCLVVLLISSSVSSGRKSTLASQRAQIVSLEQMVAQSEDQVISDYSDTVAKVTGGVSLTHKQDDDAVVREMMETALTWDGLREYMRSRDQLIERYGFDEDSEFMTVFMPGEDQGVMRTAPSGKTHSAFDEDLSSRFDSMTSYVTSVRGDVYSYFTVVTMRVSSDSGKASARSYATMQYDVANGKVENVEAQITEGGIKTS